MLEEAKTKSVETKQRMRVYRKKSNFKDSKEGDYWYSATRSDGNSVIVKFVGKTNPDGTKTPIIVPDLPAFEIGKVKGQEKSKEVVVKGETYINFTYYITECEFYEIVGEELPL